MPLLAMILDGLEDESVLKSIYGKDVLRFPTRDFSVVHLGLFGNGPLTYISASPPESATC